MFCSEAIKSKSFKPIKCRRPWPSILISHPFQQGGPFEYLSAPFLHLQLDVLVKMNNKVTDHFIYLLTAIDQLAKFYQYYPLASYHIAGKFGRGKFGEFGKSFVICQTKTIQIGIYN